MSNLNASYASYEYAALQHSSKGVKVFKIQYSAVFAFHIHYCPRSKVKSAFI